MLLERIAGQHVRGLSELALEPARGTNLLVGDNGAGKTSVLEAIFLLGRARSFRAASLNNVVATGLNGFVVSGRVLDGDGASVQLGIRWQEGRLSGRINGRDADGLTELARRLPVEVIDTQVQELVRGGPGGRRRFLDWGVFHVKHRFLDAWRRYQRALRQRNSLLKTTRPADQLASWEQEMVLHGEMLHAARAEYVAALCADLGDVVEDLVGQQLTVRYQAGWAEGESLQDSLIRARDRDLQRGYTSVGPHRADLDILIDGRAARDHGSGGQQKLIACALVLAQVRLVGETLGQPPVLLIDDPGAEVAAERLSRLLGWVEALCEQRFVTGLSRAAIGCDADAVFHVEHGRVSRVK